MLRVAHVLVPPAGRAEFVVTGADRATVLRSACVDTGKAGDADPPVVLAQLDDPAHFLGASPAPVTPVPSAAPLVTAPSAVRAAVLPRPAARRTIRFTEDDRGFYINGRAYAMGAPPLVVARSGTVEEWTIDNATDEVHDFHIHQVHFLTESVGGSGAPRNVWLDTLNVPPRRHVRVLVDFRDPIVRGTFLFHCHILDHEDQGMMAAIRVL